MTDILIAVAVVALIGAVCSALLIFASKYMSVKTDEKVKNIRDALPGANCGACGYTGCDGYAAALASGAETRTNLCVPGADSVAKRISELTGGEFQDVREKVALICCMGDSECTYKKFTYTGIKTCKAAYSMWCGDGSCSYGCIGLGDCAAVCPSSAICIENGIAHVDTRKCTGCGLCAKECPKSLIRIMDDVERVFVSCSNHDKGAVARKNCSNACIACRKCENSCPVGAVKVEGNLARIDYSLCTDCGTCASVCPVGCIKISDFSGIHRYTPTEEEEKIPAVSVK